jgi:hypothetical protein
MEPREHESNWAHACRVLSLDWRRRTPANAEAATADASDRGRAQFTATEDATLRSQAAASER